MIERDHTNYLVLKYNIDEKVAGARHVSLYAEVSDKPKFKDQGAYMLSIYLATECRQKGHYAAA